ncbi:hypothetical protein D9619_004262 [Psilocybe cf. subviscida]|uniref:Ricin B lectin domain-containing protein n=1 Tax=Psilocybe cf. subviscida TaxID=2480587 RepID=A0A8H5BQ48_9AGAR|nr:hypothetical protein D9619_004262 [Psilocybe cf. subviscida]
MKTLANILTILTISGAFVHAATPMPGASVGIQPTFRGSFPRTPCLSIDGLFDGAGVFVIDCTTPIQTRTFTIDAGGNPTGQGLPGPIKVSGNLCLTVPGGVTTSGTPVQFTPCTSGDPNQQWQWNANGTIIWAGKNKCLDLTDGQLYNYNRIQIWTCTTDNQNQKWTSSPANNLIAQVSLTQNDGKPAISPHFINQ